MDASPRKILKWLETHMKIWSSSSVITEMQMKPAVRYHVTSSGMDIRVINGNTANER